VAVCVGERAREVGRRWFWPYIIIIDYNIIEVGLACNHAGPPRRWPHGPPRALGWWQVDWFVACSGSETGSDLRLIDVCTGVERRALVVPVARIMHREYHTVDYELFITSQLASTQLTLGPHLVQIWSRTIRDLMGNETLVLHRVVKKQKQMLREPVGRVQLAHHPGVDLRANLGLISHRCHLCEVVFVWELTKETIQLPMGCLQGGCSDSSGSKAASYLRRIDSCITQLKAQGPFRTCNESKEEDVDMLDSRCKSVNLDRARAPRHPRAPRSESAFRAARRGLGVRFATEGLCRESRECNSEPCEPFWFFFITLKPRIEPYTKSTSLKYKPASEPLHISVKKSSGTST